MAIRRAKVKKEFSIISNKMLGDKRLSFKARGLLAYMLSKPDDWQFYTSELVKHSETDGRTSIQSALKEIENAGYLVRDQERDTSGKFKSLDFILYDVPKAESPLAENPQAENPRPANQLLLRTNSTKNLNQQRTDETNIYSSPAGKAPTNEPHIPYAEVIDYLNQKANTSYKPKSKANQQLIKARWDEGYRLPDFKTVIDNQSFEWQNTDYWKYMRPSTLFRASKFEGYLNANKLDKSKEDKNWGFDGATDTLPELPDDCPF